MLIASKNCIWNLSQKIPPWVILHIPPHSKIRISRFCVYCELKLCMNFHSKDTSLRNMTHNTSIPNLNSTILCIFLAEISMKFSSKDTSLRNITHTISFPNQNFKILCLFWAEVVYEGSFKRYLLENYDTNHFNSKSQIINLVLILAWNWVWNFI